MTSIISLPSTQTDSSQPEPHILPQISLNYKLSKFRRSSMKPYYYNDIGEICNNPLPAMIASSTTPRSPLKYRSIGSKFEEFQEKLQRPKHKKNYSYAAPKIPLKSSLNSKEVFVIEAGTDLAKYPIPGFCYKINRSSLSKSQKIENLECFFLKCQQELNKSKKFKYLFTPSGKVFQFLQDIPYHEKIILVSSDLNFSEQFESIDTGRSKLSQIEDRFSYKPSNLSYNKLDKIPPKKNKSLLDRNSKFKPNQLKLKLGQTAVKIDTELPKIFDIGMKKLKMKSAFSEAEIHKLYAKYKMLVHLSTARNPNHSIFSGISKDIFIDSYRGSPELNFVLERVFDCIDQNSNGTISWEEYLHAMDVMFNGTYEEQIDLFFTVYDTDGNGNLSYEEIRNLCKLQLQNSDADNVIDELSHSFASLIFDITETPYDKEIPAEKIKKVLARQTDKSLIEMFCSFSFMKNN